MSNLVTERNIFEKEWCVDNFKDYAVIDFTTRERIVDVVYSKPSMQKKIALVVSALPEMIDALTMMSRVLDEQLTADAKENPDIAEALKVYERIIEKIVPIEFTLNCGKVIEKGDEYYIVENGSVVWQKLSHKSDLSKTGFETPTQANEYLQSRQ